jgi:hypothetical protein
MSQRTYCKSISQVVAFFFCRSVLCGAWSKSQAGRTMVLEAAMSTLYVRDNEINIIEGIFLSVWHFEKT